MRLSGLQLSCAQPVPQTITSPGFGSCLDIPYHVSNTPNSDAMGDFLKGGGRRLQSHFCGLSES